MGGTIDKDYPRLTKGYAFEITIPAVERIIAKVRPTFEYNIISIAQKDSTELSDEDRERLLRVCQETDSGKILITHGTDTMIETAAALHEIRGKAISHKLRAMEVYSSPRFRWIALSCYV